MASQRESGHRGPYDDGASPLAVALAMLVLVVILLIAGWMIIPCHWVPGMKECGPPGTTTDRFALQDAVRDACRAETRTGEGAAMEDELDCWCAARRLVPLTPRPDSTGLSDDGLDIVRRLLSGPEQSVRLSEIAVYLDGRDLGLFRRVMDRHDDEDGCRIPAATGMSDQYPAQPWPVRQGCAQGQFAGAPGHDARPGDYVTVDVNWGRRNESICLPRETASRLYADGARYWLLRGDAELSRHDVQCLAEMAFYDAREITACAGGYRGGLTVIDGRYSATALDNAMRYWHQSSDWGRAFGAQAAILAQRRLQAHMVQCLSSADGSSLQRIAHGESISTALRQRALAALGYYGGPIDGVYRAATREAVRGFQRELGYDETGALTPRQATLLICHAAQTARDADVQNALGIMYALGLGVEQNIDLSLEWLETAARRNNADAYFNLALIYGRGHLLDSYRLCGVSENHPQALAYLREAAALGHQTAQRWCNQRECRLPEEGTLPEPPPDTGNLPLTCLHAETRQGQGPPR